MQTTESAIQLFAVMNFTLIGLSHTLQPRAWVDLFIQVRQLGLPGVFLVAMLALGMGSIIVSFHPVYGGLPVVLTIIGWLMVLKGATYLLVPQLGMRTLERVSTERRKELVAAGLAYLVISGLLAYHLFAK